MGSDLVLSSIERICELITPRAPLGRKIQAVWAAGLDTFTLFCSVRKMAANSRKAHVLCSCGVVGDRLWCSEFTLSTMGRYKDANLCSASLEIKFVWFVWTFSRFFCAKPKKWYRLLWESMHRMHSWESSASVRLVRTSF